MGHSLPFIHHPSGSPHPLTKQIILRRAYQIASGAAAGLILEATHNTNRRAIKLAADQAGSASQFIGHSFFAGVKHVAVGVAVTTMVEYRLHARDSYRNFGQALAPRPPERI
jgi:hypothetical protein